MTSLIPNLPPTAPSSNSQGNPSTVSTGRSWEEKSARCRDILAQSLNQEWLLPKERLPPLTQRNVVGFIESCGALSPRELEITGRDAHDLVAEMAAGRVSAVETTTAFLKRAHIAHQLVNFATEFLVQEALSAARELDAHFAATGKIKGPLHGLPISIKEHIGLKGRIVHSSYVAWAENIVKEDALIVTLARNAGGVIHVRTNIPQTVMMVDCANPIYGATVNPYNGQLTPGGSSGGEGASLGLRCAALGIGTDVGGSVRAPAAFCGAYGLKTTSLRNPYAGITLPGLGQESIRCVASPLANSIRDLELFERAILEQEPWDLETSLMPIPWKKAEPIVPSKVTIGVMWDDGLARPHPPVWRAMKKAVAKAKAAGFNLVDWEPYEHHRCFGMLADLYFPDAAATQRDLLVEGGEPISALTQWTLELAPKKPLSVADNWALNLRRDEFRDAYHRLARERGVDVILCPSYVGAAAVCGTAQHIMYTALWNLLDWPAVVFQTGVSVDPAVDVVEDEYTPRSAIDEAEWRKYVPENFAGAPIALQLVGKRYQDETLLAVAAVLADVVMG
ncbi:hypothetical protein PspLS_09252 [Pyricularia sp. CBS 133598]|nr:hypothetical protein PspLS_09252 [Pyricularia sp. CBS 133598]